MRKTACLVVAAMALLTAAAAPLTAAAAPFEPEEEERLKVFAGHVAVRVSGVLQQLKFEPVAGPPDEPQQLKITEATIKLLQDAMKDGKVVVIYLDGNVTLKKPKK